MSSATLLRAYRLAAQREGRAWGGALTWTGATPSPGYVRDGWAVCREKQARYAQFCLRIEARLLQRLGADPR